MAISDKITSIKNHLKDDWDSVESLIGDTELDKNIENISSALDDLYNDLPKVTGSGTTVTLEDTRKGRLESTLSGNTSQFTTTGKNLLPNERATTTENGITITKNDDGTYKVNGTASADVSLAINENTFISMSGTWRMLGCPSGGSASTYMLSAYVGYWGTASPNIDTGNGTNITHTGNVKVRFYIKSGTTCNNLIFKPMLTTDTNTTINDFEPYTGGQASPNPNFPQDIHVVSGDNKINVCGKNLLDLTGITARTVAAGITITPNFNGDLLQNIKISGTPTTTTWQSIKTFALGAGTYILSGINVTQTNKTGLRIGLYIDNARQWFITSNSPTYTFTLNETTTFQFVIWVQSVADYPTGDIYLTPLIRVSSETDDTYEPYQSNTYNINLPVENLFNKSTAQLNVGINTSNGNTYGDSNLFSTEYIPISINTTYRANSASTTGNRVFGACYDSNKSFLEAVSTGVGERKFTVTNANAKYVRITGQKVNIDTYQLEKGSKSNSYTPYGTTPIELGVISTYKDKFIRTSGKNLFDNTYNNLGMWVTNIGETTTFAQGNQYLGAYCKVEPGTYTISRNKKTNRFRIGVSPVQPTDTTSSCYVVASNDNASSITIDVPQGNNYICIYLSNNSETSTNVDLMIEKGSSASDYQPYGTGEWYYKEVIKKVVLNGTETISAFDATSLSGSYQATFGITARATTTDKAAISDKFIGALLSDRTTKTNIVYSYSDGYLRIATNVATTMAGFKTWLGTNNPKVLLEAATPTYNKITYEPLLEQLEAYYHAKSKATQTNIFQENNDLPFEIDASALEG